MKPIHVFIIIVFIVLAYGCASRPRHEYKDLYENIIIRTRSGYTAKYKEWKGLGD